jgi:protein-L-isoaspartate(D-aspartate) O-methyltransferase
MGIKKKINGGQGNEFAEKRKMMVDSQIRRRGVKNPHLLAALEKVPRHLFVPPRFQKQAYNDEPLPIGYQQTISQPYIVAYMVEQLQLRETDKVLEIGTGSGYQTAILAELSEQVYSIEIVPELARQAEKILRELSYKNVHLRTGDGHKGWPEAAPFDAIVVSAAPPQIPQALGDQLSLGGRMIIPIGNDQQDLIFLLNTGQRIEQFRKIPVRFVPMTGKRDDY